MRARILKAIVFFSSLSSFCFSQTNWEDYYPLHIGDFWEYQETVNNIPTTVTRTVTQDTLLDNGIHYKLIKYVFHDGPYPDTTFSFERVTPNGIVLSNGQLNCEDTLYVLPAAMGDSFGVSCRHNSSLRWTLTAREKWLVFSDTLLVMQWSLLGGPFPVESYVAYHMGLILETGEGSNRYLRGAIIDGQKYGEITVSVDDNLEDTSHPSVLHQNYPNPFNSQTTITFSLQSESFVQVEIFDVRGKIVRNIFRGNQKAGLHAFDWNGNSDCGARVSSGIYFVRLMSGKFTETISMVLLK